MIRNDAIAECSATQRLHMNIATPQEIQRLARLSAEIAVAKETLHKHSRKRIMLLRAITIRWKRMHSEAYRRKESGWSAHRQIRIKESPELLRRHRESQKRRNAAWRQGKGQAWLERRRKLSVERCNAKSEQVELAKMRQESAAELAAMRHKLKRIDEIGQELLLEEVQAA